MTTIYAERILVPIPVMPAITLAQTAPENTDVLVIGIASNGDAPILVGAPVELDAAANAMFGTSLLDLALSLGADAKIHTTAVLPAIKGSRIVVVGLGEGDADPEVIRQAAGAAVRAAQGLAKDAALHVALSLETTDPELLQGAVEGALLGAHTMIKVTQKAAAAKIADLAIICNCETTDACATALKDGEIVARNVIVARDWVNMPANLLYPETFAKEAQSVAANLPITVEMLDDTQLEAQGYGGIMAVGKGSARKPRLVRFAYAPAGAAFHLAIIGKGITFDSGGLDIKPADGMYTMKCDMGGAAAALAATRAIAELGLNIKVTTYAAMAENMPSGEAYRPSDVLTMYGGKTVENANTDAEGRLVMGDALARANEDEPDLVVDIATLTGACMVALGERITGLMASDDQTADLLLDAAEAAGEELWQLPIPQAIRDGLSSKIADIKSSGSRLGGAMAAAAFLQSFVAEETPYAHLDIAGPAFNTESPFGYVGLGGSGVGVRTLVSLARSLQH
ncbi:MAG: leucyl aminopeptidase [Propionibacteriaceae bacterium]